MELTDYTYKFRIYPTPEQEIKLAKHFGCVRWCYNHFLDKRVQHYMTAKEQDLEKKCLNYNDDAKVLTELKKEIEWLNEVNSQSLQHALKHLDSGFNRFYKKLAKFPRFKNKRGMQSFRIPQGIKIENNILYIIKFREGIKFKLHRPIEGEIRNATITKNCAGQYHVSIGVQREIKKYEPNNNVIGIDLGLKTLATCSDGTRFSNIRPYRTLEARRRILAKNLSRAVKGSKGREKARKKLAKLDNYIRNIRHDYLHKVSHKIVSKNQTIIMEDLNASGMMKNRKLSKSIWDCSLYELVRQIRYKSKWYGREFLQVSRWFPSSKTCSNCGYINDSLTLADREWKCPRCEILHDRDFNASCNIKRRGLNEHNRGMHGDSCLPWRKTLTKQGLPTGTEISLQKCSEGNP
jgi:putative transposase